MPQRAPAGTSQEKSKRSQPPEWQPLQCNRRRKTTNEPNAARMAAALGVLLRENVTNEASTPTHGWMRRAVHRPTRRTHSGPSTHGWMAHSRSQEKRQNEASTPTHDWMDFPCGGEVSRTKPALQPMVGCCHARRSDGPLRTRECPGRERVVTAADATDIFLMPVAGTPSADPHVMMPATDTAEDRPRGATRNTDEATQGPIR